MRFTGSSEFVASPDRIWAFLIDPTRFGPCAPVPIERVDETRYRASTRIGSGMFSATIGLDMQVVDVVEGRSARIVGRGGASGTTVEGSSAFQVRAGNMDGTTIVDWEVELRLAGPFAGPAGRVIEDRAPAAIHQLLDCIQRQLEA